MSLFAALHSFYRDGGAAMWPTTALGFLALVFASRFALVADDRPPRPAMAFALATLGCGALGTCAGLMASFHFVQQVTPGEVHATALLGIAESLSNLLLALMLCTVAALLIGVGHVRRQRQGRPMLAQLVS